jgi:hypothetical protein
MKLIPRTFDQGRILMRLVAGLVAPVVRHATEIRAACEHEKNALNPSIRHYGELIDIPP